MGFDPRVHLPGCATKVLLWTFAILMEQNVLLLQMIASVVILSDHSVLMHEVKVFRHFFYVFTLLYCLYDVPKWREHLTASLNRHSQVHGSENGGRRKGAREEQWHGTECLSSGGKTEPIETLWSEENCPFSDYSLSNGFFKLQFTCDFISRHCFLSWASPHFV